MLHLITLLLVSPAQCDKLQLLFVGERYGSIKSTVSSQMFSATGIQIKVDFGVHVWSMYKGTPQPHPLECLAATDPRLVWASYGAVVKGFRRGREVCRFHGHRGNVTILLPFGEHLISIDDQNCLKIWSVKDKGQKYFIKRLLQCLKTGIVA